MSNCDHSRTHFKFNFFLHRNIKTNNRTDKGFKIVLQAIHFQWIVDQILGNPIADI